MSRNSALRQAIVACSIPTLLAAAPVAVHAQDDPLDEIVVTGSFIRGTPQDAALPVDVMTREDLQDAGNPTIVEMVRNLNISNGNIGETNQFDTSGGQGTEGVSTVNLRGLGSARTLVLLNGRRHVATSGEGVDIAGFPSIAMERLEVLKDGAAALYGSDAIAGVVNFITRSNFEGIELRAEGQTFDSSDGEAQLGVIGGWSGERLSGMVALEYQHRSEVELRDLDWATRPFDENPQSGWSAIGNPGTLFPLGPGGNIIGQVPDPVCDELGNETAGGFCRFQFTQFDNLVEEQDTYKAFGEMNLALSDTINLQTEAMYSVVDSSFATSPSYPPQALFGPDRVVPVAGPNAHPGLVDFMDRHPGALPADTVAVFPFARHAGAGGFQGGPRTGSRETELVRLAGGLDGTLFDGELGFDVAISYSRYDREVRTPDMFVERMAFALDGLGGPDCDPATGTPGEGGCLYHTPTSNAVGVSAKNGFVNPDSNPDLVEANLTLQPWLEGVNGFDTRNELLVFDATLDGQLQFELDGGPVGYAIGLQARNEKYDLDALPSTNLETNPCPFVNPASVTLGNTDTLDCTQSTLTDVTGPFAFLSGTFEQSTSRTIYGAFLELNLPINERLNGQFAVRFEDYGGEVGTTVDPKLALRYQATDAVVLRGSVSTTFRGPPQNFLEGRGTALGFLQAANAFKAIDTLGNPGLSNEEALATNFGIVYDSGNFFGSIDYWRFDFSDPIQLESQEFIVDAFVSNDCVAGGAGVGTDACNALTDRLTFQPGAAQTPANISRVSRFYVNGGDITTSGIDWFAQYDMDTDFGLLSFGTQGTYTHEYDTDDFTTDEGLFLAPGGDFAGKLNADNPFRSIVDWKGSAFIKFNRGIHRATITGRYWGKYDDDRAGTLPNLQSVDDMFTLDLNYNVALMDDAVDLNLTVFNLFDTEPPRTQQDMNYDPWQHNPFGRMIKVGVSYTL